mmetsp:Transcript_42880/g.128694  ORF Transcript_42880/g.128694 Transcript_42880/m.128694 type:complete len:296 (-) Transcript_42880:6-893(-)
MRKRRRHLRHHARRGALAQPPAAQRCAQVAGGAQLHHNAHKRRVLIHCLKRHDVGVPTELPQRHDLVPQCTCRVLRRERVLGHHFDCKRPSVGEAHAAVRRSARAPSEQLPRPVVMPAAAPLHQVLRQHPVGRGTRPQPRRASAAGRASAAWGAFAARGASADRSASVAGDANDGAARARRRHRRRRARLWHGARRDGLCGIGGICVAAARMDPDHRDGAWRDRPLINVACRLCCLAGTVAASAATSAFTSAFAPRSNPSDRCVLLLHCVGFGGVGSVGMGLRVGHCGQPQAGAA